MAGARGNYSDNEVLHGGDLNADLTTVLGNDAAILAAVLANWNWLISGGALSAGSGYDFTVAPCTVAAQGIIANLPQTSLSVGGNSSGSTRTDLVVATVTPDESDGTNPTTNNPVVSDQWVLSVVPGTPGKATLGADQVQIGSVAVPNGATGIGACTLNSGDTGPNSQGPLKSFVDVLGHITANITGANVHGVRLEWGTTPASAADGSGNYSFIVGFPNAFTNTPTVTASFTNYVPPSGARITVLNVTSTGMTIAVQGATPGSNVQATWHASGT